MTRWFFLVALACLAIAGCEKDEPAVLLSEDSGEVFVRVATYGQPLAGFNIVTDPVSVSAVTDVTGTVLLTEVPVGSYRILATRPGYLPAASSVMVVKDQLTSVEMFSYETGQGGTNGSTPYLSLNYSYNDLYSSEPFTLTGILTDDDPVSDRPVVLSSDLMGALDTGYTRSDGSFSVTVDSLTVGTHFLSVTVTDTTGLIGTSGLTVYVRQRPPIIEITSVSNGEEGVTVSWQATDFADFSNYHVLRSTNGPDGPYDIYSYIYDREQTTFVDNNVPINTEIYYRISIGYYDGDGNVLAGKPYRFSIDVPVIELGTRIVRLKQDASRPYLYALDGDNNRLLFINTETNTMEKSIFVGSTPTDMAFSLDNTKLYVANSGSSVIAVVDLDTRTKVADLAISTQGTFTGNPGRLAVLEGDRLAYTTEYQSFDLRVISIATGEELSTLSDLYSPGLVANASGTVLYASDGGYGSGTVVSYRVGNDGLVESGRSNGSISYGLRDAVLTADNQFIFSGSVKLRAGNLGTQLGTFTEPIRAANTTGTLAVGETTIFDGTRFTGLVKLPVRALQATVSTDDTKAYVYEDGTERLVVVDLEGL